tara:strand:- start:615 stop:10103 length:9489 start_codon:yes stop_codon:yes gene_type:complete
MPTTSVNAPDGGVISVNHPDGASDDAIMRYAASMYGQDPSISKRPEEENITLTGRISEAAKAVPRGFASGFLTAAEGLAELSDAATNAIGLEGLIDSGDENALVYGARQAKEAINSTLGADKAYQDLWFTKFGEGLGSFATFLTPGAAFRLAGYGGKAATGLVKAVGAKSAAEAATVATLATGTGAGEQAQRIQMARDSGIDISQAQEDSAIALASIVGLSELAPVGELLRKVDKNRASDDLLTTIGSRIKSALGTGGVEAVQEAVAGLTQDLIEKNIYNEELPIGESLYDDFTVGGAVGFVSDLALNAAAGRRRGVSRETEKEYETKRREANAQAAQDQAELVSNIGRVEVLEPQTIMPDQDDVQGMPSYARKIARDMGQNFPLTVSFGVQETTETVTRAVTNQAGETIQREEQVPAFVATDSDGRIYGKTFQNYEQAAVFAGALNDQLINRAVTNSVSDIVDTAPQAYDQPTFQTLSFWGNSALNPENNTVTSNALNMAAGTTIDQGFNEQENSTDAARRVANLAARGQAPVNPMSLMTASQRANWNRLGNGQSETNVFTFEEAKKELGDDVANLADVREDATIETETYRVDKDKKGKPVVVSSAGEIITQRPTTLVERREKKGLGRTTRMQTEQQAQAVAAGLNTKAGRAVDKLVFQDRTYGREEIKSLLEAKNVTDELNSPQIKALAQSFTGKSGIDKMSRAEMKLFYLKLRSLPRFEVSTSLPVFTPKIYTSQQFRLASQHIGQNPEYTNESLADAIGVSETDPRFDKKIEQITADLNAQGVESLEVAEETVIPVERRLPSASEEITQQLEKQLSEEMDRLNLGDVRVNVLHALTNVVRDADGNLVLGIRRFDPRRDQGATTVDQDGNFVAEGMPEQEQALYSRNLNEVFFGVDRLQKLSDEGATPEQLFETAKSLLNHESVHAMRMLDLWTANEWSSLEKLATKKKNSLGQTYLDAAKTTYSDLSPVYQMEEAVAELIRDGRNKFSGKPRTLIRRIQTFFESMLNFLRGTGYTSFDSLIGDIESGTIGARDRDQVRTLRATEAARGVAPDRGILPQTRPTPRGAATKKRLKKEGDERVVGTKRDAKGRTNTYYSKSTTDNEGYQKTTFTFNRSDRDPAQRNTSGVSLEEAGLADLTPYEDGLGGTEDGKSLSEYDKVRVTEVRTTPDGQVSASVLVTDGDLSFENEIAFKPVTKSAASQRLRPSGDFLEVVEIEEVAEQADQAYSRLSISDQIDNVVSAVLPEVNRRRGRKPPVTEAQAKKAVLDFRASVPEQKGKLRPRDSFDKAFKTLRRDELSQREALSHRDVSLKIPEIAVSTILLKDGLITRKQRNAVVNQFKPVTSYESLPDNLLTTKKRAVDALDDSKKSMFGKTRKAIKDEDLEYIALRLDIPAYLRDGAWVVTAHKPRAARLREGRGAFQGQAGTPIGYELAMSVNDVSFGTGRESDFGRKVASGVATGAATKNTFATIEGRPETEKTSASLLKEARAILKDMKEGKSTNWTQVGYDPERHSYFYDRTNGEPIVAADRVIQIGPLVLAQNANVSPTGESVRARQEDFAFSRTPITVPPAGSDVPALPIGDVERGLYALISATGGSPSSSQLADVPGAPNKRVKVTKKGNKVPDNERDSEVRAVSLDELRQYMREGLKGSDNLQWYDQFGSGLLDIVGPANIEEASVIFGITSQQNSAEQNLADTLHIMSVARRIDPVKQTSNFMEEVSEGRRPGGQKLKITGDQINRITRMYKDGFADAGLKTSTYMQLIQDRARNKFNPFSVQDVHMARVFGFRRKGFDKKTGNLVDTAMIPGDLQYRYAQYLTSYLAEEFNITPNQAQAALWFYAKSNLSPKSDKKEGAGTWESAKRKSAKEINVIEEQIAGGMFNRNEAVTPALKKGVRPRNAVKVKQNPYTNFINMPDLEALAEARAPSITVSANPGNARGYGFPSTVTIDELFDFHEQALDAITDKDGQIPFLRRLGIPHKIELAAGTYEGLEPSFQIKLLGGSRNQALLATSVLGDALLQDAAIAVRPAYKTGSQVGLAVKKPDGSAFTRQELEAIATTANPEKDPEGMNFTAVRPDTLVFMDGRTFDPEVAVSYTPEMGDEFATKLLTSLDTGLQYDIQSYLQESDYVTKESTDFSSSYSEVIREIRDQGSVPGSLGIFDTLDRELYKPFWDTYTQAAARIGFTPESTARPRVEELVRAPLSERLPPPPPISQNAIDKAVEQNLKDVADAKSGAVPRYSTKASPEAQAVARDPEIGATLPPGMEDAYSRKNVPDYEPDSVIPKLVDTTPQTQTAFEVFEAATGDNRWTYYTTKFRNAFIDKNSRIESLSKDPYIKDAVGYLADVSANAAMVMKDKSKGIAAAAIKYGNPVYRDGLTKVEAFINSKGDKIDGIIGLLAPLQASGNTYGKNLEEVAQAYAIGRRVKYLHSKGRYTDKIPIGKEDEYLAELEREADKYINPETGDSIIREWYQNWSEYNDGVVQFLKDTGVITEEQGVEWASMSSYYPFYMEADGETQGIDFFSGMSAAPQTVSNEEFKAVGKSGKPVNVAMFDAIVKNITSAIDMGMTNVAYQRAVRDQVLLGQAQEIPQGKSTNNKYTINFRVNGEKKTFELNDPLVFEALKPIGESYEMLSTILGAPANLLRETVTRDPGFIIVNMMRDTLSSYVTSGSKYKPVIDTVANFASGMETLEKYGIVGGYDLVNDPKDLKKFFDKELRRRGIAPDQGLGSKAFNKTLGAVWEMLGTATTMSDAATRKAVFDDVLARTGNEAEAAFQALEVINFARRGSNPVARLLFTAIPFLNARIQGLDVFYRAFAGKYSADSEASRKAIAGRAISRGLLLTTITGLYWGLVSDDDEYKLQSDEVRDNNWIIPTGTGYPIKIPIPFEVGLVFKTIPERAIDAAYGEATDAREMAQSVKRGLMSTLEVNPLGIQAFAPAIEAALNHNFYTGRPIVPYYIDQGLAAGFQSRVGTNKLAEYVGESLNISPMKIEHFISGYLGTIGGYALDAIDKTLRSEALVGNLSEAMPSLDMQQFPLMKRFFGTKEGSGVTQDFYEIDREVNRVVQTLNSLKKQGKAEELQAYLMGREGMYSLKPHVNRLSKTLAENRKRREAIIRMDIDPEEKRKLVDEINAYNNDFIAPYISILRETANLPKTNFRNLYLQ